MTARQRGIVDKLRQDVEGALAKELGENPELVSKIEKALADVSEVALDDVAGAIQSPLVRALVKEAFHSIVHEAFG